MGCGGSKTDAASPRRRPQRSYARGKTLKDPRAGGAGGAGGQGGGNAGKGRGRGRNKINNNEDDVHNENINRGPIYEKGYKKRIRENLRNAAAGEEIEPLEKCMEIFINNHMEDGGDLTEAERRLDYLQTRKYIRDACMRQHPVVLDKAIQRVEASPYRRQLKPYLDRAYYLKQHQEELDTFRHDILNMEQSTISEIRSYNHPPGAVHNTMVATYLCLGYPESHLLEWTNIQNFAGRYGKESLINEVRRADTKDLDDETSVKVKKYLNKNTLDEVRTESTAAACFHVWDWVEITALMGRYGKDSLIREISLADPRKIDKQTASLARGYLSQYSLEEVRSVSSGAAVFYIWASRMVGKFEGDKKGSSAGQPQPKQLTNSRRGNTPTNEQNQGGQFKAKPVPMSNTTKDTTQNQKQAKAQQNQAKQAQKQVKPQQNQPKQTQKNTAKTANTSAKNAQQTTKTTANDTKQTAKSSTKDAKQTTQKTAKDTKANVTQAKSQANNISSKTTKRDNDPWGMNAPRKAW